MPDQASIFNDNSGAPPQNTPPQAGGNASGQDELVTLLSSIKNERGEPKYKSVQDALNALKHSQEYIPSLKQTKEELEQKLNDAMAKIAKMDQLEQTVQQLTQRQEEQGNNQPQVFDEGKIAELVTRTLSKTQQEAVAKQNQLAVVNKLKEVYGDKAEEVFYGKASELGLTIAEFNALAAKTPKAVLNLVGVSESSQPVRQSSGVNTVGFQPKPDSFIGRNKKSVMLGASRNDIVAERQAAANMVEELHSQGLSISDLTKPEVYFKHFSR